MEDSAIQEILQRAKVIAVVGLSPREDRPSYRVASYLKGCGYRIIPVNPAVQEVLGERAYGSLGEIPDSIEVDVVDVFRRPEDTPAIAEEAVARKARVLWLQEGIVSQEAKDIASASGLQVVMDRCMLKEHKRLIKPGA